MTPLTNPQTPWVLAYNEATRTITEHTNCVLKVRWLCLDAKGGILLYKPKNMCKIILACFVLCNIAMKEAFHCLRSLRHLGNCLQKQLTTEKTDKTEKPMCFKKKEKKRPAGRARGIYLDSGEINSKDFNQIMAD